MDLTDFLKTQMQQSLSPALIDQLTGQMGGEASREQVGQAASSSMSVLLNALARNAATPDGAQSLNNALEKDNHGGLLDSILGGLTGGSNTPSSGGGGPDLGSILGSLTGGGGSSQGGGMDMGSILGGLVTGMMGNTNSRAANGGGILDHILGRRKEDTAEQIGQQSGLSTGATMKMMAMLAPIVMGMLGKTKQKGNLNADGLGGLLDGFLRSNVSPQKPASKTNIGLAGRLLDRDGDGSSIDDIAGMIGGFFNRR